MLTIELNMYHAVALGAFLFWLGGVHVSYPAEEIDTMGNMFLSIFLAMALAGLKLWELIDLAMPMVICLVLQCVVMFLFSYFVVFNVMSRNYDAAVMTAGFIGRHGQHAGRDEEIRSFAGGVLCHPDGRRHVH